jgi:sec-independent protein translocase protein TatC
MLLLLVPLYLLYEFAIIAIRLTHWRAARRSATSAPESDAAEATSMRSGE